MTRRCFVCGEMHDQCGHICGGKPSTNYDGTWCINCQKFHGTNCAAVRAAERERIAKRLDKWIKERIEAVRNSEYNSLAGDAVVAVLRAFAAELQGDK